MRRYFSSLLFFFSSRRRHTRFKCDWSSDVCSSDLLIARRSIPSITSTTNRARCFSGSHSSTDGGRRNPVWRSIVRKLFIGTTFAAMENHRPDSIPNDSYPVKSDRLLGTPTSSPNRSTDGTNARAARTHQRPSWSRGRGIPCVRYESDPVWRELLGFFCDRSADFQRNKRLRSRAFGLSRRASHRPARRAAVRSLRRE